VASHRVRARAARGDAGSVARLTGADEIEPYLSDAAYFPGGACDCVYLPVDEAQVAAVVRESTRLLVVGDQSSLTGGATPAGGTVLSTARMASVLSWNQGSVRAQAGLSLAALDVELRARDLYYPPVPTYDGATLAGTVSTNAAGAATFRYGTTREWVRALTVVLADGDVLDLRRGRARASAAGRFEIERSDGSTTVVEIPRYRMPAVPKRSAGYFAEPGMDLVDLFVGSEGTLGVITEVELGLVTPRPGWLVGLLPLAGDDAAVELVGELRALPDTAAAVAAVEYMDARCLQLLREDDALGRSGFELPNDAACVLLFQVEVPAAMSRSAAFDDLAAAVAGDGGAILAPLIALLSRYADVESVVVALPGEDARRRELFALREAVPMAVNRRIGERQRSVDTSITKCAADVIVPFDRLRDSLHEYRRIVDARRIDHAIWGHISDGNLHPNMIPASAAEARSAREALLELGEAAIALGGCPMSEHGVGRNATKQTLLERLYGSDGVDDMRRVKAALDPNGKLAPGVIFYSR
jgi:D-lactate dehydrogenase (cytochrome)